MKPTTIPKDLDDRYPITLDEFCALTRLPRGMVLDWREHGVGPRWVAFNGNGRLHITAAEARRFMGSAEFTLDRERES